MTLAYIQGAPVRQAFSLVLLFVLCACAVPPGPKFEKAAASVSSGEARLVVIHDGPNLVRMDSTVLLDGKAVCSIAQDDAMTWTIAPGNHVVSFDTPGGFGTSVLPFTASNGNTTYIVAYRSGKKMAAGFFFGVVGELAGSDKSSPEGGTFALQEVTAENAAKVLETKFQRSC